MLLFLLSDGKPLSEQRYKGVDMNIADVSNGESSIVQWAIFPTQIDARSLIELYSPVGCDNPYGVGS